MKLLALLTTPLLFLFATYAAAADDLPAKIKESYEKVASFEAGFQQSLFHKESGSKETRKGNLVFQKPLSVRWHTAKPHEELIVISDKEIWDYIPDEEVAYRYAPSAVKDSRGLIQVLTGQVSLAKDFDVKNAGAEKGLTKLALYPKDPTPQLVEGMIWVDPANGYIKRAKIIDFYGNSNEVTLTSFTPKKAADAKQFRFTPPKGVEIEDRTKDSGGKELFK